VRKLIVSALLILVTTTAVRAENCYNVVIQDPNPFNGNGGERITLSDGSVWKNISYLNLHLNVSHPTVIICPDEEKMTINDKVFQVVRTQ